VVRKFPKSAPLGRVSRGFKQPKPKIVVVCEGKVTEPKYLRDFRDCYGNSLVTVTTIGGCGVPVSVVERAIEEKQQLVRSARASKDLHDTFFEVWAVFDRDAHPKPQVPHALDLARKHGIQIGFSNPCFELWGLMHFSCVARPGSHHETQKDLKRVFPTFCHEKNPVFAFEQLKPKYLDAVANATKALKDRAAEGHVNGNPSTTVHLLTERIRQFGRA